MGIETDLELLSVEINSEPPVHQYNEVKLRWFITSIFYMVLILQEKHDRSL